LKQPRADTDLAFLKASSCFKSTQIPANHLSPESKHAGSQVGARKSSSLPVAPPPHKLKAGFRPLDSGD